MQNVVIGDRKIQLREDVFIIPKTVVVSEDGRSARGLCRFPSTVQTVADRVEHHAVPHANVVHGLDAAKYALYVLWNCAGILSHDTGMDFLVSNQNTNHPGILLANTELAFHAQLLSFKKGQSGKHRGLARIEISSKEGELLAEGSVQFVEVHERV